MAAALVIVFREILEAGLIVGIVLAVTRGIAGSRLWIAGGLAAGLLGSLIVAAFTTTIANAFEGYGQELFNAGVLAVAVLMLAWHNVWMARHGREMVQQMQQTGRAVKEGERPMIALAVVVGTAVLREGSEVVLFLYGIAISGGHDAAGMISGSLAGLAAGAAISGMTYFGLVHIPSRYLFRVTGWLVTLLAAGMAAQSVSFLERAGAVEIFGGALWNSAWLLPEDSIVGRLLHTLVGYADSPSILQGLAYAATIAVIVVLQISVARPVAARSERAAAE